LLHESGHGILKVIAEQENADSFSSPCRSAQEKKDQYAQQEAPFEVYPLHDFSSLLSTGDHESQPATADKDVSLGW
jgi:hypothetical protein